MAALGTASLDSGPSSPRPHACAEAVLALAATDIWLIRAFHGMGIQIGEFGVAARLRTATRVCKGEFPGLRPEPGKNAWLARKVRLIRERKGYDRRASARGFPSISSPQRSPLNPLSPSAFRRGLSSLEPVDSVGFAALESCRNSSIYSLGGLEIDRNFPRYFWNNSRLPQRFSTAVDSYVDGAGGL